MLRSKRIGQLHTITIRQAKIEQANLGLMLLVELDGLGRSRGMKDGIALALQHAPQDPAQDLIVIHYEDFLPHDRILKQ